MVFPGIAGDDPTASAVADDDDRPVARVAGRRCARAVTGRGDAVPAGLYVADDVVQHRAMCLGGKREATARLIEVAAFQTKLKLSGYNPAKELNDRLIARMTNERAL